jgi:DnaJ like chaperone protein
LEQVLAGLYQIARADGPVNAAEADFLDRVAFGFGLNEAARRRAAGGQPPPQKPSEDAYTVLGLSRRATEAEIRARWKQLVREHHPDVLASQGASPARIKIASEKVARINAAYDSLKRERQL